MVTPADLIFPLFVVEGKDIQSPIPSMPGNYHWSVDRLPEAVEPLIADGILGVILFGVPDRKDPQGSEAYNRDGVVPRAIRTLKDRFPDLIVVTDVCLCQYTDHGHCGVVRNGTIDNDASLPLLAEMALSHAQAGADIVAPSDMMDGRVAAIRQALDENGLNHVVIMSYSAKYASAFYGPFRDAAHSSPEFGDRRSYQMDPGNVREAMRELRLDVQEGADIVMVKPALAYMDVIAQARRELDLPIAAYNVSGEYAMIKAAAEKGWLDERAVVMELLTALKRAGSDIIITYFAPSAARWLQETI